jgi:hypothetical protein
VGLLDGNRRSSQGGRTKRWWSWRRRRRNMSTPHSPRLKERENLPILPSSRGSGRRSPRRALLRPATPTSTSTGAGARRLRRRGTRWARPGSCSGCDWCSVAGIEKRSGSQPDARWGAAAAKVRSCLEKMSCLTDSILSVSEYPCGQNCHCT